MDRGRAFLRALACAVAAASVAGAPAGAQISDTAVKAAFIPKFARYVTWPASAAERAAGQISICIIGANPFGNLLTQAAAGQQVDGRSFAVRHLSSTAEASGCAIAFVNGDRTGQVLAALDGQPVLTVTDGSSQRGVIHFTIADGRVRFFIDNAQARSRGLTISSRLLALALGVNQK